MLCWELCWPVGGGPGELRGSDPGPRASREEHNKNPGWLSTNEVNSSRRRSVARPRRRRVPGSGAPPGPVQRGVGGCLFS
nr:MAG TPA: hypothetical protein [Caudoviricetes sp.]